MLPGQVNGGDLSKLSTVDISIFSEAKDQVTLAELLENYGKKDLLKMLVETREEYEGSALVELNNLRILAAELAGQVYGGDLSKLSAVDSSMFPEHQATFVKVLENCCGDNKLMLMKLGDIDMKSST